MNRGEANGWNNPLQTVALKGFKHRTLHVKNQKETAAASNYCRKK